MVKIRSEELRSILMAFIGNVLQGGYVEFHRGAWRVHGILAVSRSIGNAHLKNWVLAEPDTKILHFTSDMEFLVLASDGFWDEVRIGTLLCTCWLWFFVIACPKWFNLLLFKFFFMVLIKKKKWSFVWFICLHNTDCFI